MSKVLQVRVTDEFLNKIEFLKSINGFKSNSDVVKKVIEKEYKKETEDELVLYKNALLFACEKISTGAYFKGKSAEELSELILGQMKYLQKEIREDLN